MGHILFGLPEIGHFHLLSRVARKLFGREHRVSVLTGDPVTFEFYAYQGLACMELRSAPLLPEHLVPVAEFALIDCRLAGHREPTPAQLHRATERLERRVPGLIQLFEQDPPDLVAIHEGRTGLHRLLHFVATHYGAKVMHTGTGLLPMTLQVDREGIDGDASFARATAQDYRGVAADDEFLGAATAAWLGRAFPPPLARLGIVAPPLRPRLIAGARCLLRGDLRRGLGAVSAWRQAQDIRWPAEPPKVDLPHGPYACLLLQDREDPAMRLDTRSQVHNEQLVRTTWQATQRVDPSARLVVVDAPSASLDHPRFDWAPAIQFIPPTAAAHAVALAMAVVTVNHPLALAAILAETPVVHTAAAPYGIPGIAARTDGTQLAESLALAMVEPGGSSLRRRFLTRILRDHHIWCPPQAPDSNGVVGVVRWMEDAIGAGADATPLRYRPGPVWPLAAQGARRQPRRD